MKPARFSRSRKLAAIAAEARVQFHTDAVQAAGKLPLDVEKIGCNLLSISGHKIHAPQGTGVLFVRKDTKIEPLLYGGTHERQRRAGTENLAGIVGLGKAAEIARQGRWKMGLRSRSPLSRSSGKRNSCPCRRRRSAFDPCLARAEYDQYLVRSPGRRGAGHLARLEGHGCFWWARPARRGKRTVACADSHAVPAERARASLRFSLSKLTTAEDVDFALKLCRRRLPNCGNSRRTIGGWIAFPANDTSAVSDRQSKNL